jgi:hypothetical protein
MRYRLRRLATLSPSEFAEMFWAQGMLLWAQALVWFRPRGSLIGDARPSAADGSWNPDVAQRLARAVNRAAYHGLFRPYCLVRAVALNRMLEARGMHAGKIRVGVRLEDGEFSAHAWVDYAGVILGDEESKVRSYAELADVRVVPRR